MAKAKKVTKRRSRSGWGRFIQDNAEKASEKAKDTDKSYLSVLSGWWKEVPEEIKQSYNKDQDFVHIYGGDASVAKKPAEKPKADETEAEPEPASAEPVTEADSAEPSTEEATEEKSTESTETPAE